MPALSATVAPGYEAGSWGGVIAPAALAPDVKHKLHAAIVRSLKMPERKRFGGTCVNTGCVPTKTLVARAPTD